MDQPKQYTKKERKNFYSNNNERKRHIQKIYAILTIIAFICYFLWVVGDMYKDCHGRLLKSYGLCVFKAYSN
jgi:hypothetical protein